MIDSEKAAKWQVFFTSSASRQKKKLPPKTIEALARLIGDMEQMGPIQKDWSHFTSLGKMRNVLANSYHCHIKSGRPTYVVCWRIRDKFIHIIEIYYVGTHENAPY
jgi:mRNA-degrading endonuclease RelE of RelBE toxin-antitoxin system